LIHTPSGGPDRRRVRFEPAIEGQLSAVADTRFIALMMAYESLLQLQLRPSPARAHVDELIRLTKESQLEQVQIDSLTGSLKWLRNESISQAGRRLAASAGTMHFMRDTEDAVTFFTRCYDVRSRLVHGHTPRPDRGGVDIQAADLERLLGHFLSESLGLPPRG
jgi:hypothetical protein